MPPISIRTHFQGQWADLPVAVARSGVKHTWATYSGAMDGLIRSADCREALVHLDRADIPVSLVAGARDPVPVAGVLIGSVRGLGPGRWFVYAELQGPDGQALEAWLPAAEDTTVTEDRPLYAPPVTDSSAARLVAGAALLLVVLGLLVACLRIARRARRIDAAASGNGP